MILSCIAYLKFMHTTDMSGSLLFSQMIILNVVLQFSILSRITSEEEVCGQVSLLVFFFCRRVKMARLFCHAVNYPR